MDVVQYLRETDGDGQWQTFGHGHDEDGDGLDEDPDHALQFAPLPRLTSDLLHAPVDQQRGKDEDGSDETCVIIILISET